MEWKNKKDRDNILNKLTDSIYHGFTNALCTRSEFKKVIDNVLPPAPGYSPGSDNSDKGECEHDWLYPGNKRVRPYCRKCKIPKPGTECFIN